ncbi:MAG: S26 family signal peptidase, partial [Planctomycetota bacterium]
YRPTVYPIMTRPGSLNERNPRGGTPALATGPNALAPLHEDEFFTAGDNSPASSDSRLWEPAVPWVSRGLDAPQGIVPRELILGKAFFVYYPSPEGLSESGFRFIPGFGKLRWIR